jgi:hypothetical protein
VRSSIEGRRAFMKILGSWIFVIAALALWGYLLGLFRFRRNVLRRRKQRLPGTPSGYVVHKGRRTEETRRHFEQRSQWKDERMILNANSGVVHWPHPALFKSRHIRLAAMEPFSPSSWADVLGKSAYSIGLTKGGARPIEKRSEVDRHFDRGKEGIIRETLALSVLEGDADLNFSNIDEALRILLPAIQRNAQQNQEEESRLRRYGATMEYPFVSKGPKHRARREFRPLALYVRLVSLKNEGSSKTAQAELAKLADLGPELYLFGSGVVSPELSPTPAIFFSRSQAAGTSKCRDFECWHRKTVAKHPKHDVFRRKLKRRILAAQEITGKGSSSGKDTPRGEWSSNLQPFPLQHRRRPFLSKLRKQLRRKLRNITRKFSPRLSRRQRRNMPAATT